eukprot:scaffold3102_cov123-Isochrysis_galbana.AAC.1
MPVVRPDLRRNEGERQISNLRRKKRQIAVYSSEILQNWTAILRFVENSTEILRNGHVTFILTNIKYQHNICIIHSKKAMSPYRLGRDQDTYLDRTHLQARPMSCFP